MARDARRAREARARLEAARDPAGVRVPAAAVPRHAVPAGPAVARHGGPDPDPRRARIGRAFLRLPVGERPDGRGLAAGGAAQPLPSDRAAEESRRAAGLARGLRCARPPPDAGVARLRRRGDPVLAREGPGPRPRPESAHRADPAGHARASGIAPLSRPYL